MNLLNFILNELFLNKELYDEGSVNRTNETSSGNAR